MMEGISENTLLFFGQNTISDVEKTELTFWDESTESVSRTVTWPGLIDSDMKLIVKKNRLAYFDYTAIKVIDLEAVKECYSISGYANPFGSFFSFSPYAPFSADGNLFFQQDDEQILVYESASNKYLRAINTNAGSLWNRDLSSDGKYFAFITSSSIRENIFKLIDTKTGKEVSTFVIPVQSINRCSLSPDAKFLLIQSFFDNPEIWDTVTGAKVHVLQTNNLLSFNIPFCFSWDGKQILVPVENGYQLQDVRSGRIIQSFSNDPYQVKNVEISRDSSLVGFVQRNQVDVYQLASGKKILSYPTQKIDPSIDNNLSFLRFSPDGKYLLIASGNYDTKANLLDLSSGRIIKEIRGYPESTRNVVFTDNGATLIFYYADGNRAVWDISPITNSEAANYGWQDGGFPWQPMYRAG